MAHEDADAPRNGTPTYVSDLLFQGVRVLGPEESEAHLARVRRALAKRGLAPRRPPEPAGDRVDADTPIYNLD